MQQFTVSLPRCRVCRNQMLPSDEQDHFSLQEVTEFVCVYPECLEFGLSKAVKDA